MPKHLGIASPSPKEAARFFQPGISLPLLYLSPHFAVIAKPAGMAVYPTQNTNHKTVEEYLRPQKRGGPWLVHRLDQETAGCLLIARRKTALIEAQTLFSKPKNTEQIRKTYWAILDGRIDPAFGASGEINLPLRKIRQNQKWFMEALPSPQNPKRSTSKEILSAQTKWRKLGEKGGKTWVELELLTGRTHQARVHCRHLGAAILGDALYGEKTKPKNEPLCLLARSLFLSLPSGETVNAMMPPPDFMQVQLKQIHPDISF